MVLCAFPESAGVGMPLARYRMDRKNVRRRRVPPSDDAGTHQYAMGA